MIAAAVGACTSTPPTFNGHPATAPAPATYWTGGAGIQHAVTPTDSEPQSALLDLSVERVVDLALRRNPATRASWTASRAAADLYGASRGALLPELSASAEMTQSRVATGGTLAERSQMGPALTLSYLVLDFGARKGTIEAARQTAIAASFAHNSAVQNTILGAQAAAFDYLAARALRDAARASVAEAEASLNAAEERHRVGLATIADVLQARTARADAALSLETIEGDVSIARGALAVVMGFAPTAAVDMEDLPAPDSSSVRAAMQSADSVIALAMRNRPDLSQAVADADRAAAEVRIAESARRPALTLDASGGYGTSADRALTGNNYRIGIGVSMPLLSSRANGYTAGAAIELRDAAAARLHQVRQDIALQVFTSYHMLQTATSRVRTSADLLASALASDSVALGRYAEGVGSIVDLLIAQTRLADARAQAVTARWQWRSALAVLAHDAGILDTRGRATVPLIAGQGGSR
jgi:outer membrane protein TolC